MRIAYFSTIAFFLAGIYSSSAFGFKEDTHQKINSGIAARAIGGFDLSQHLQGIGLEGGKDELIQGETVYSLFAYGGRAEDNETRFLNHFHDPLEELPNAGYGWLGKSAIVWAQLPPETQSPGGYYSWRDARAYYYSALIATHQTVREEYFAKVFRSLGQVMHLVQDMSVPEHARDDGHILPAYESWVLDNGQESIALALDYPLPFDLAALRQPSPKARVFDTSSRAKHTSTTSSRGNMGSRTPILVGRC